MSDYLNKLVRLNVIFATLFKMEKPELNFEKQLKEQLIIEAAQKRFGLFGLEKTSMREIADDLNLSKASLYYYFPDKESLYRAVVEKEQTEFLDRIRERITTIDEPDKLLREYTNARLSYFRTLLNLSRLRFQFYSDLRPVLKDTMQVFRDKEKEIIVKIIDKGIRDGLFFYDGNDADQAASLFLDMLRGLRMTVLNDRISLVLDQEEYDRFLDRTNAVTEIFIRGLMFHL
jgi:AcrR family transcriptional regulator